MAAGYTYLRTGETVVLRGDAFPNGFGGYYPYTVSSPDGWINVTDSSSTGAPGDTTSWTVAPYSGATLRTGTIVFHVGSPPGTSTIPAYQLGVPTFEVTPNSVTVPWTGATVGPNIIQDLTETDDPPAPALGLAVGWTATDTDAWISFVLPLGRPFEGVSTPISHIYTRGLGVVVAANGHADPPRVSVVTVAVTSSGALGSYLYSGSLPNDWSLIGILTYTINQDAGPDYIPGGGGGGPGAGPYDGSGYKNPFNLPEAWGYYLRTGVATTGFGGSGKAVCLRANKVAPFGKFDAVGVISPDTPTADPRIAYQLDVRRLLAVYTYAGNTYFARSDDDGHTWGGNVIVIAGSKHPTIAAGIDRTVIIAAYVAPVMPAIYGTISVAVQGPGDITPGAAFTLKDAAGADILVADDSFHLCQPPNGARLWVWALMIGGEGGCSEWYSGEPDSKSVTRVV